MKDKDEIKAICKIPFIVDINELGVAVSAPKEMDCIKGTLIGVFRNGFVIVDENNAVSTNETVTKDIYAHAVSCIVK